MIPVLFAVLQDFLGVGHGGRHHVAPTGPFPQIDGSTSWAAERELRDAVLYLFLADRTAELDRALARHERYFRGRQTRGIAAFLNELCHNIVIVRFCNLAAVELSRRGLEFFRNIIDEHLAVNFRSVHLSAPFQKQLAFLGFAFEQ